MKKVGLAYPIFALLDESTGVPVYTQGKAMGKAIKYQIKYTKNSERVDADDSIDEYDNSVTGATETLGLNEIDLDIQALLYGRQYVNGVLSLGKDDVAPYVGHGLYTKIRKNHQTKYAGVWFYKVIYGEPDDDAETQGEKIKFNTPSIEGTAMFAVNNMMRDVKVFDTLAEVKSWLNGLAGILPQCSAPVASVASGSYATANSVTLTSTTGATIHYTTNGLTPTASSPTYSTAIAVNDDMAIRAIAVKDGYSNSEISEYEYIITA